MILNSKHVFFTAEKSPGRAAKVKGQLSITSMFDSMSSKRKSSSSEGGIEKKIKTEANERYNGLHYDNMILLDRLS